MSLPVNIKHLINGDTVESDRIEFKKSWDKKDVIRTICAFANDVNNWSGGYIVIGIEEKNGQPILPPVGIAQEKIDTIQKQIVEVSFLIEPHYSPVIELTVIESKHILLIWVPGGDNRPYKAPKNLGENQSSNKYYWIRRGSTTIQARGEDERKLIELANKIPFDDRVNHNATLDDIDVNLIEKYLSKIGSQLIEHIDKLPKSELCRKMNIARGPDEYLKPVNIGLLMFNKTPENFFRGASIEIVIYEDEVGDTYSEKIFSGPLNEIIEDSLNYIKTNIIKQKVKKVRDQAESLHFFNYPFEALEEALVNAVYHKSYEHQSSIEVSVRLDKIEILSIPGPIPPLDNEMLKRPRIVARDYRNRRIGDFLKELKLTEGRGTGIPKIRSRMKQNGSFDPIFETNDRNEFFLCVLPIHPEFIDLMLDDYKVTVLNFCKAPKSRKEILSTLGISNHYENYKRHIFPLIKAGYLDFTLPGIPNSRKQKYKTNDRGLTKLKIL